MENIKILSETESHAVLGGYGVIFGGKDLTGETFTAETDFDLPRVKGAPVMFDHTLDDVIEMEGVTYRLKGVKQKVGRVIDVEPDDIGLYMQLKIEKAKKYWELVRQSIENKQLPAGLSTGTAGHLTAKSATGEIKAWPIAEVSITMTPAEPRTTDYLTRLKSFVETAIKLGLAEVHEPETASAAVVPEQIKTSEADITEDTEQLEKETMPDEVKPQAEPEVKAAPVVDNTEKLLKAFEVVSDRLKALEAQPVNEIKNTAPPVLKHGRGDSEAQNLKAWAIGATGSNEFSVSGDPFKASNATDMNIGTAADGGNAVPTGFYPQIIARRDETSLRTLPLMRIPGTGTTVNVPLDGEADGEFITKAEATTFDLDSPAIGTKALTLVKYTKYLDISHELLEDTPTAIESFLAEWVGRGMAKTDNNLLLTEVASNGTLFKTFAGTAAIAFGEPEDIVGNNDLGPYLESDAAAAWVMRRSSHWDIKSIVGSDRQYAVNSDDGNTLLGYPVRYSQKAAAMATSAKSVYFGNWRYVAYREAPGLTFIRDPYTVAVSGQVRLIWYYRIVFGVLQAEAIGYGAHASA